MRRWVLVALIAVGCRGSEQAKPEGNSLAGSAHSLERPSLDAEISDAAPRPVALIEQMRALPRTAGDRTKATALHREAMKVHAAKQYPESERLWSEAARADPSWDWPFYNLACSTALQTRPEDALAYMEMMRDRNPDFEILRRIETDKDLQSIRRRPDFEALFVEISDGIHARRREPAAGGTKEQLR